MHICHTPHMLASYYVLLYLIYTHIQTLPLPSTFPSSSQQHWHPAVREALSAVTLVTESYTRPKVYLTISIYSVCVYVWCICKPYKYTYIHTHSVYSCIYVCMYTYVVNIAYIEWTTCVGYTHIYIHVTCVYA